ncbi:acylneuraminate cytidylyltransferase [Candidatus Magnetoovum chiemensis]|nr:acylneuraminate cytidylyltransferase [Candidatus Magnetoovum chiemensis]
MSEKTFAFIPVRLSSKRLPQKHFKYIGDKSLLSWVIYRLKQCLQLNGIVICTVSEKDSDKLADFAKQEQVELFVYENDVNDVVGRLTQAAIKYDASICVLASGDCPLLNCCTIDGMVSMLKNDPTAAHVSFEAINGKLPIHEGIVISRRWLWELSEQVSDNPYLREHHFPVFLLNVYPEKFKDVKTIFFKDKDLFYCLDHRISIDTPSDLKFMNALFDALKEENKEFNLENSVILLDKKRELEDINKDVHQKKISDQDCNVVFFIGSRLYAHYEGVFRTLEIAKCMVNEFCSGVRFITTRDGEKDIIEENNFYAVLGDITDVDTLYRDIKFDIAVLDLSRDYNIGNYIAEELKLRRDIKKVVFIGSIENQFIRKPKDIDLIIMPEISCSNTSFDNLKCGRRYVVIREEIKNAKKYLPEKQNNILINTFDDTLNDKLLERAKTLKIGFTFSIMREYEKSYPEALAKSKVLITSISAAAYEAVYLDAIPLLIALSPEEQNAIEMFYEDTKSIDRNELAQGARNIAEEIFQLMNKP